MWKPQALGLSLAHSLGRNLTHIQGLDPSSLAPSSAAMANLVSIGKIIPAIAAPLQSWPPKDGTTNTNMFLR